MDKSDHKPIQPITVELAGSELPESIVARLPERPAADQRFFVTVETALTEEEELAALRRDIEEGLADIEAGRVRDVDDVFDKLQARLAKK